MACNMLLAKPKASRDMCKEGRKGLMSIRPQKRRCMSRPKAHAKEHSQLVNAEHSSKPVQTSPAVWTLIALQGVALLGALVGGLLARKRRYELITLTTRLRQVNAQLRKRAGDGDPVCAAGEDEAVLSYRKALETAMGNPSAAHPYEVYGSDNLSLAKARQKLSVTIKEGRSALYDGNGVLALEKAEEANGIATEIQDKRASRAVSRLRANALNNLGQYKDCLGELQAALNYSEDLKDHSHDADILGEIADAYADLGNFEQAAKVYDKCLVAIQNDYPASSSTWDC